MNSIIGNISKGTNETVENFLKNYKKSNELIYQNKELQEEIINKNDEIKSLTNGSGAGKPDFLSGREEYKSELSREGSSRPEFDANDIDLSGSIKNKTLEKTEENQMLRSKIMRLEEEVMDTKNLNNIIMEQNNKLKLEVKELDAKVFENTSIEESKHDGKFHE